MQENSSIGRKQPAFIAFSPPKCLSEKYAEQPLNIPSESIFKFKWNTFLINSSWLVFWKYFYPWAEIKLL